ncbi:hypothetical protein HDU97_005508 [Phlyctochytrium planicorne]|nr:hypothetical protein HDU97_005508 [Phlyctochytrium planicorne]
MGEKRDSDDPSTDEDGMAPLETGGSGRIRTQQERTKRHIERLMNRIEKPITIPERRDGTLKGPKDFVRNVQGSSAGAGSGEFHVYRALRRKEYARLKMMETKSKEEESRKEFQAHLDAIKQAEDEKTAKKREKRKKRKQGGKDSKKKKTKEGSASAGDDDGDGDEKPEEGEGKDKDDGTSDGDDESVN